MEKWEVKNSGSVYSLCKMNTEEDYWPFNSHDEERSMCVFMDLLN